MSMTGQCVAVAGKCGLAHCTLYARKWKLFGNETQVCFVTVECSCHLYVDNVSKQEYLYTAQKSNSHYGVGEERHPFSQDFSGE